MGYIAIIGPVCVLVGLVVGYLFAKKLKDEENKKLNNTAEDIISKAKRESDEIIKEAKLESKELIFKGRQDLEKEIKEKKKDISYIERKLEAREESLEKKMEAAIKKEEQLVKRDQEYDKRMKDIDVIKAKNESEKRARSIISTAIQRCASEFTNDITVTLVNLPSDEMKGRIIGREGRNIRTFETITGVDIIVDDTPEAVILSSYDPFRRETAKLTLEKLITDGRIHPARIEELHQKSRQEMEKHILELGEETVFNLGIHNISQEILKLIGRLKYRTSYGQNVLGHSIEVATIAGIMAAELGMDPKVAKRAGLLHDIGKAIDYEAEGSHTTIGVEVAKKNKEDWRVINAIASHHGEEEFKCIEAVLVQASDAISASRPGARREVLESYIKRLEQLEDVASSFDGVSKSFAIQAGREVRIIVEPDKVNDDGLVMLSKDISKKVEEELTYPGQIKVMVIRESRAIEFAK